MAGQSWFLEAPLVWQEHGTVVNLNSDGMKSPTTPIYELLNNILAWALKGIKLKLSYALRVFLNIAQSVN